MQRRRARATEPGGRRMAGLGAGGRWAEEVPGGRRWEGRERLSRGDGREQEHGQQRTSAGGECGRMVGQHESERGGHRAGKRAGERVSGGI